MRGDPRSVRNIGLVVIASSLVLRLSAQNATPGAGTANSPDVVGAERLFFAWLRQSAQD
jgi:hypothetical protein